MINHAGSSGHGSDKVLFTMGAESSARSIGNGNNNKGDHIECK
jgi:hypothetical protein